MAKALKCDRCGKYYDIPKLNFETQYRPNIDIELVQHGERFSFNDICQECTQELVDWLNLKTRLNKET